LDRRPSRSAPGSATVLTTEVNVDALMSDLQTRVRERLRGELLKRGESSPLEDPQVFADVERLLRRASDVSETDTLLLPEVLGDPATWKLQMAMRYQSHRTDRQASFILFVKRRLLMPMFRWLFEYSRDNFDRQRRVNLVLFACVQELAAETALLRQQIRQQSHTAGAVGSDTRI
jgi:hypothetical protein